MKTIIAGSRDITNYDLFLHCIQQVSHPITAIFSGGARGVDKLGERYAQENNIPLIIFPADWGRYGRGAGMVRNQEMLEAGAEAAVIIWDGKSRGTLDMNNRASKLGLRVTFFEDKT